MREGAGHPFKRSCGLVEADQTGTGYLVSPDRVVTCAHVVGQADEARVHISDAARAARVLKVDLKSDCAVLGLLEPVTDTAPMLIGGRCRYHAAWDTWGFPSFGKTRPVGIALSGVVEDPEGQDDLGSPAIQLESPKLVSEMGAPLHGFSGSPVVVEGAIVGHLKRMAERPDFPGQPAYGTIWATPSENVLDLLGIAAAAPISKSDLPRRNDREAQRILLMWKEWRDAGMGAAPAALAAAQSLIELARPELALEVLPFAGDNVRGRQLRALAMAKLGGVDDAITILEQLRQEGQLDAESGGLLAGRYKQKWLDTGESSFLQSAFQGYHETFERTGDQYPGINAAAAALWLGKATDSRFLAQQVLKRNELAGLGPEAMDHWELATVAEAFLLLGRMEDARDWYSRAVARNPLNLENIAAMRRQARRDLEALNFPRGALDAALPIARVAAFAGHMVDAPGREPPRFPPEKVEAVGRRIADRIRALNVAHGFSSAARGSDLLFLEALLAKGGRARVFLPFPREAFEPVSVGEVWNERFHSALEDDRAEVSILHDRAPLPAELPSAFLECSVAIQAEATAFAQRLDERPVLLAVWNEASTDDRGGTADAIRAWREKDREVEIIPVSET